jgi:putative transposase
MEIYRSYFYYRDKRDDTLVEEAIREASRFDEGFWKIYQRIKREGKGWNHKKVYRVYKAMHYNKRSKLKRRLPVREKHPLVIPEGPNITWSVDFVSDKVECGRQFRVMNILDDFNRCAVGQEISMSMPTERVIRLLEKVIWLKGKHPINDVFSLQSKPLTFAKKDGYGNGRTDIRDRGILPRE